MPTTTAPAFTAVARHYDRRVAEWFGLNPDQLTDITIDGPAAGMLSVTWQGLAPLDPPTREVHRLLPPEYRQYGDGPVEQHASAWLSPDQVDELTAAVGSRPDLMVRGAVLRYALTVYDADDRLQVIADALKPWAGPYLHSPTLIAASVMKGLLIGDLYRALLDGAHTVQFVAACELAAVCLAHGRYAEATDILVSYYGDPS